MVEISTASIISTIYITTPIAYKSPAFFTQTIYISILLCKPYITCNNSYYLEYEILIPTEDTGVTSRISCIVRCSIVVLMVLRQSDID